MEIYMNTLQMYLGKHSPQDVFLYILLLANGNDTRASLSRSNEHRIKRNFGIIS